MTTAVFALVGNVSVAALFAAIFFALSLPKGAPKSARWFALAYMVGMLTPLSELGVRFTPFSSFFAFSSFLSFTAALLLTAVALSLHLNQRPPWKAVAVLLFASVCVRFAIWDGPRNTMPYELFYQLPFAATALLSWWVSERSGQEFRITRLTSLLFLILSLHFVFKAQAAVIVGSGATAQAYASSVYALLSQSLTGVLLSATGLLMLYLVFMQMLNRVRAESEVDVLSGLLNRRGFETTTADLIEQTREKNKTTALILFDIDHFKQINDTYGHPVGDLVIQEFAVLLRKASVPGSVCARVGGEEFAVFVQDDKATNAPSFAEFVRGQTEAVLLASVPVRISAGVAAIRGQTSYETLFEQADSALYLAKRAGRNQVKVFRDHSYDLDRRSSRLAVSR